MIASTLVAFCCLVVAAICLYRSKGEEARRNCRRAFFAALPIGLTVIPFGYFCAGPIMDFVAPGFDGYQTVMGAYTDKETPVFLAVMILGIAVLAWPVAARVVRVDSTPRAILCISLTLAAGHVTGWCGSDVVGRCLSLGPYSEVQGTRSESATEIVSGLLTQSSWFLSISFITTIVVWLLVRRDQRVLPFAAALVLTTLAIFPVIVLPEHLFPEPVEVYLGQYALFIWGGQVFATAVIAVAGLTWVATRGDWPDPTVAPPQGTTSSA